MLQVPRDRVVNRTGGSALIELKFRGGLGRDRKFITERTLR